MSKWIVIKVANADDEPPIAWLCSECGEAVEHEYKFCPECGADMRGESDETD